MTIEAEIKTEVETPTTETDQVSVSETPVLEAIAEVANIEIPAVEALIPEVSMPEVPAVEALIPEISMPEVPAVEALIPEVSMPELPAIEALIPEISMPEVPAFEALIPEVSMPEVPAVEALIPEVSMPEVPAVEALIPEISMPEVPAVEALIPEISMPEVPAVEALIPEISMPEVPAVEALVPEISVSELPVIESLVSEVTIATTPVLEAAAEVVAVETPVVESSTPEVAVLGVVAVAATSAVTPVAKSKAPEVASADAAEAGNDGSGQRVVRTLAVGQEVKGLVKRTSEFGAFVDIGVGRDGLVHVSELSTRRVAKVTDVLTEGAEAIFWIKELDRDRNRISLTMIQPGTKTVRDMQKGDIVKGTVSRIMAYGAFIDIGIGRDALLHVREMGERFVPKPEDVVTVGEEIEARIIEIERRRARVDLSVKGLRPEPEPEPVVVQAPSPAAVAQAKAEEAAAELVDKYADLPAMSAIEAAFKRAMGNAADDEKSAKLRKQIKSATEKARNLQEDVITRTLKGSR